MKMQKMISAIMSMGMLMLSLSTVAAPLQAMAAPITTDDLGLKQANYTGVAAENIDPLPVTIAKIIRVAMGLLGIVAVVIILIGGFTWMTAGGNEEKVAEAKKWIFSGIIGLAIILSAFAIASYVITNLVTATTGGGSSGTI